MTLGCLVAENPSGNSAETGSRASRLLDPCRRDPRAFSEPANEVFWSPGAFVSRSKINMQFIWVKGLSRAWSEVWSSTLNFGSELHIATILDFMHSFLTLF